MKVAYITVSMPYGPVETFLIAEAKELVRQGCDLLIIPRSPTSSRVVNADASDLQAISVPRPLICAEILWAALREILRSPIACFRAFTAILRGRSFIVFLKNLAAYPKGLWLGRLARTRGIDHIHAHWALTTATIAMLASEVSGVPWSFTAHRGDIAEDNLLARKVRRASFVRFVSQSGLEMAESLGAGCSERKAVVVRMGVNIPEGAPTAPNPHEVVRMLCPANLLPVKGHVYLLDAIRTLKARGITCSLVVAGDGALRQALVRQSEELGIGDSVRFAGFVPHDEVLRMYERGEVDIVVLPSVDLGNNVHEGVPIALVEAMSYGIAAISTTTGGIPELMAGGVGVLVPPKDAEALADAIEGLTRNPQAAARTAAEGRRRILEEYAIERVVSQLVSLFEDSSSCSPR